MSEENTRPLGEWLRQRREELGISLQQAEAETRIRARYLEALEKEEFQALPDPVVGRGFLRNYAAYLGLDPKEASDRYSQRVAPPQPEPTVDQATSPFSSGPFRPVPLHAIPARRSRWVWMAGPVIILLAALAVLVWQKYPYVSDYISSWPVRRQPIPTSVPTQQPTGLPTVTHTATAVKTSTPITSPLPPTTPTLMPTFTPTFTPSPSPTPSPPIYTGIFLELVFTDTSWIQISVDGVRQFQGELGAGTYRSWYGEERIELRIGNAGAVEITVNGQKLGKLGGQGEVVDRVFEKVGEQVAESTVTPQATSGLTPTLTVKPTALPPTSTATVGPTSPPPPSTLTVEPTESPPTSAP